MSDYQDLSARTGNLTIEIAIVVLAVILGYMFYDGLLTANILFYAIGLR